MAIAGSRLTAFVAVWILLVVGLSSAVRSGSRSRSEVNPDMFVGREQLLTEMQDEESIHKLKNVIERLTAEGDSSDKAAAGANPKSRDQNYRRAAFDDEDPLHIMLGNERPDSTRDHKDGRKTRHFKRKLPLLSAYKRSDVDRGIASAVVDGVSRHQRRLGLVNRPSRHNVFYSIGAAEGLTAGDEPSFIESFYGSRDWGRNSDDDPDDEYDHASGVPTK